jgi:hypothetical protein
LLFLIEKRYFCRSLSLLFLIENAPSPPGRARPLAGLVMVSYTIDGARPKPV